MAPRWEPSLEDYVNIAVYLLGSDRAAVTALPRLALAESALHAPFASFGGVEAYPTLVEQAAVLLPHLAKNHPLPDANMRAAFLLANTPEWGRRRCHRRRPVKRVATGEATHEDVLDWIRERTGQTEMSRRPSPERRGKARKYELSSSLAD